MSRSLRLRAGAVAVLLSVGCDVFTEACTLLPCTNSLQVKFDKPVAFPFQVELSTPADEAKHTISCAGVTSNCSPTGVVFYQFAPHSVIVKVIGPSSTTTATVSPSYATTRPNGPDCGPECTVGTVNVVMTGS